MRRDAPGVGVVDARCCTLHGRERITYPAARRQSLGASLPMVVEAALIPPVIRVHCAATEGLLPYRVVQNCGLEYRYISTLYGKPGSSRSDWAYECAPGIWLANRNTSAVFPDICADIQSRIDIYLDGRQLTGQGPCQPQPSLPPHKSFVVCD